MKSLRSQFVELIEQGRVPAENIGDALHMLKIIPDGKGWRAFIDQLFLWLGGLSLAFAVMFFIAYNWNEIGRFAKFGMVEGLIVLAIIAYCRFDCRSASSKVSLLVATIFVGVLLALYGQIYQTGADTWQLFFTWSLLMLPWAVVGRFPAILIVWVLLVNISIILYFQTFRSTLWFMFGFETGRWWATFIFNTVVLAAWEFLAEIRCLSSERWAVRLLAAGSGFSLTLLVLHSIFSHSADGFLPGLVWVIWLSILYLIYRRIKADLFMLACVCLSGITVIVSFAGRHIVDGNDAAGFLFLALLVLGMGAGAAFWLKNVHQEIQS